VSLIVLAVLYIVVYLYGYSNGSRDAQINRKTSLFIIADAYQNLALLTAIRSGKNDLAIDMLELSLDANIIEYSKSRNTRLSFPFAYVLNMNSPAMDKQFKDKVTKYRKEYPTQSKDTVIKALVEQALEKL